MIVCVLTENEIVPLYKFLAASLNETVKSEKKVDADKIMSTLYNALSKTDSKNPEDIKNAKYSAANYMQHVPAMLIDLIVNEFDNANISDEAFAKLRTLSKEFKSDEGLNIIVDRFTKKTNKNKVKEAKRIKKDTSTKPTAIEPSVDEDAEITETEVRYKPFTGMKGTIQEYVKVDPTKKKIIKPEKIDYNVANMNNILRNISASFMSDDGISMREYKGKTLALKAMPLLQFYKENPDFVDKTTKAEISRSAALISKGQTVAGVTQASERVVIVLTDEAGELLYFDEAGNLVTRDTPNASVVYQFMYDARKSDGRYNLTDISGIESKVLTPEEIAEKTYTDDLGMSYADYIKLLDKQQQEEFKAIYDLKDEVLNLGPTMLQFEGISTGMSSELNNKDISFEMIASLGVTRKDFKTIRTLKKPEGLLSGGVAAIVINGKNFQVDRVDTPEDIIDQVVEVLLNKKLKFKQRMNFIRQFIPEGTIMSRLIRRHEWLFSELNESITFNAYEFTFNDSWELTRDIKTKSIEGKVPKGQTLRKYLNSLETDTRKFYIVDNGKTVKQYEFKNKGTGAVTTIDLSQKAIKNYTDAYIAEAKEIIKETLMKGWSRVYPGDYFPTKLNYNEELLDSGEYLTYDIATGKFQKNDYLSFVMSLPGKISIKTEDPGLYNNYIGFSIPSERPIRVNTSTVVKEEESNQEKPADTFIESETRRRQKEVVKAIKESPSKSLAATVLKFNTISTDKGFEYTLTVTIEGQEGEFKVYRSKNKPTIGEVFELVVEDVTDEDKTRVWIDTVVGKKYDKGYVLNYGKLAATDFKIDEPLPGIPIEEYKASQVETVVKTEVPQAPAPESPATNTSKALDEDWGDIFNRSGKFKKDNILTVKKKAKQAKDWWYNSETGKVLSKYIDIKHAANLVNSDVFAQFVVSGATLLEDSMLGEIRINPLKGSFIDVYHEAFHVFTQLFLTKEQKNKLYEEVRNYTDEKGNQPYINMSHFEIEEMMAEDFRTYAKNQTVVKNRPTRNTLFRRILNFLKALFSNAKNLVGIKTQDVITDSSNVPVVGELFNNLYFNNDNFINNYQPTIDNVAFNILNRGVTRVNNTKDQVLSERDSDDLVKAIDSIISEKIDSTFDKRKALNAPNLKAGVLGMLTNDTARTTMYNHIRTVLEEKLEEEKKKLFSQEGVKQFSEFKTLEDIKSNAVGVLKSAEGKPKYIFLKSQIDTFTDLIPDIKKGQRVKGDLYYDIRIVADFFRHASIKDKKASVDIMVVSKLEDAQVQFDNYIKAKAKVYTGVELKTENLPTPLNQEQEFILDNIRILETALSEFGDPLYWQTGAAPKGLIAYHLDNTEFSPMKETLVNVDFEGQDDYDDMLEDEEGNEVLLENDESKGTDAQLTNDLKVGKYSLLQMAEPRTIYVLKSLFAKDFNDEYVYDRFGFKRLADFKTVWNTVAKVIGGTQDISEIYSKLKAASKTFPILKQLIDYKLPDGKEKITNTFEFETLVSFWQTFRKPRVPYIQSIYYPEYTTEVNPTTGVPERVLKGYYSKVIYASTDSKKILRAFRNEFEKAEEGPFIAKINNKSHLKLEAVVRNFIDPKTNELDVTKQFQFANAIGIYLDDTQEIKDALKNNIEYYGLQYLFSIVKDFYNIQKNSENPNAQIATEALEELFKFKTRPVPALMGKLPANLLPSIKANKTEITQQNVLERLAELQAKSGHAALNLGVRNADGNLVFENIEVHSMFSQVDGINSIDTLADAWKSEDFEFLSYLDPVKNTFVNRSVLLNSIFKIDIVGDTRYEKRKGRKLEIAMDDGSKIAYINEGTVSADLDKRGLFIQEMNSMLKEGFMSTIKLSDKKTTIGIRVKGDIIGDKAQRTYSDPHLYVDVDMFHRGTKAVSDGELYAIKNILLQHFAAEFDRIKRVKENKDEVSNIKGLNRIVDYTEEGEPIMAAEVFMAFDNILRTDTKNEIYSIVEDVEGDIIEYLEANDNELLRRIQKDIFNYFNDQITQNDRLFASQGFFVDEELDTKTGIQALGNTYTDAENSARKTYVKRALVAAYTYNAWIHQNEVTTLFIGDLYNFDHSKEDTHKRDAGATSGGRGFADSAVVRDFINNYLNKGTYDIKTGKLLVPKTYAETLNFQENTDKFNNFVYDGKLRTAVLQDAERQSIYLSEMQEAWAADYREEGLSEAEIKERVAEDSAPYEKMTESDGAAFITIDAYRTLKNAENAWSDAQEKLYQKIIKGEQVSVKEVKKFFPIYKLQGYGPLHNTVIPAIGMHKFAITPIIPGVNAKAGSELEKLHRAMLKQNIQYILFGSGSKVASVTSDGNLDNVFADTTQKKVKPEDEIVFTPNITYLRYLKNVTNVNDKYKKKVVDSTQQRVVITDGLFETGQIKNEAHKKLLDDYKKSVDNNTNLLIAELLHNIGFIYKDRKYIADKNSLEKFVSVIRKELGKKAVPKHLVDLLGVTTSGSVTMDYSIHPEASVIEKVAMGLILKRIVNQKVKGEPLVQAPTTFTNGLWDKELELIKDPAEIKKLVGTNNLAFYSRGKYDPETKTYGPTNLAKTVIAMQGDFQYLYELKDLNDTPIKESADPLATLNALIKNDEWLDKDDNRLSVTIMGPRIPNDAHNTIEGLEIWHFLEPAFGNIVIVPTEIVAKAGADFDVDKLTLGFPAIGKDGKYISKPLSNKEFKDQLAAAQENEKLKRQERDPNIPSVAYLIERQKAALANETLRLRIEILKLPENFGRLTKPNATHLVERYAEAIASKKDYDKLANSHGESPRLTPVKPGETKEPKPIISPSRVLEIAYNLDKHEVNTGGGSAAVGIFAKNNKLHIIHKQIGTQLPRQYRSSRYVKGKSVPGFEYYDMVIRFPHNVTYDESGEEVINLGGERTQKGTLITDINSHNLQGVLDRAKKSFPADLNITPDNINMINTLIAAGVDEELVFHFINQPLIIQYLKEKQNMSGIYGKITGVSPQFKGLIKSTAIKNVISDVIKRNGSVEPIYDRIITDANNDALINTLNNLKGAIKIGIPNKDRILNITTIGELRKKIKNNTQNPEEIFEIRFYDPNVLVDEMEILFKRTLSPSAKSIYNHVAEMFNDQYGQEEYSLETIKDLFNKKDNSSLQALALFMHYIQLENALAGFETAQMYFSPDTGYAKTVQEVKATKKAIKDLVESGTIDPEMFEKFDKKAIVSSFRIDDLVIDTLETILPLRLNETISEEISNFYKMASSKFPGKDGRELFSTIFNDSLINYIYQNTMSSFVDDTGKVIDYPTVNDGMTVEQNTSITKAVVIEGNKILINPEIIEIEFTEKYYMDINSQNKNPESFMSQGYYAFTKDPFERKEAVVFPLNYKSNYIKFLIERELLRAKLPENSEAVLNDYMYQKLKSEYPDNTYEVYLAKFALMNSFNPNYILGKAEFNYATDVVDVIGMMKPEEKFQFPILNVLSEQSQIETPDKLLQLNDTLDEESAQAYYRDLIRLGDLTTTKSDSPALNSYITRIFKNFSLYMFYQNGVGYSRLGFVRALDASSFVFIMRNASLKFIENIEENKEAFGQIYTEIVHGAGTRNFNAYDPRYDRVSETIMIEGEDGEEIDIDEAFIQAAFGEEVDEDSPVADVINRIRAIETNNRFRAKDIEMFKASTAFIGYETTANDPVLESKSSTKVYRESFGELANKGKYSPTDVVALSGSGNFGRKGELGIIDLTDFIDQDFRTKYAPEINRAIEDGVTTFLLGSYNDPRNRQDYNIQKYLESKGYRAQTVKSTGYTYYKFTLAPGTEAPIQPSTTSISKSVADIPQNKVSGIESYGSKVTANNEAIKALGPNPHSIDMIEAGFRTRTTRSESEMAKYAIKVGDIIKHFGKSADGSTKTVYAKVTAIHPKGSEGWKGTWNKEGWRAEDVNVIDRFKDGAAAIEFEVIQPSTQPVDTTNLISVSESIESLKAREAELIIQKEEVLVNSFEAVVVDNLPRINPESARKETGLKTGTTKDINPMWLSKDGMTVEEAAHRIWEDFYFESNYDTQDVRNVIIDVLSSAKSKKEYLDNITGQTEIDQIRKDIRELQQQATAPTSIQLNLFDNVNAPEGLPGIKRSKPDCAG